MDKVYQIGDKVIRAKAKRVRLPADAATKRLIQQMIRTMRHNHLVGIAAPQIGVSKRIFVTEPRTTEFRKRQKKGVLVVYINPQILNQSKSTTLGYEGCGSVAHASIFGKVARSKKITILAYDLAGRTFTTHASGLLARIIQHEYDHLEGKVFLDRLHNTRTLLDRQSYVHR